MSQPDRRFTSHSAEATVSKLFARNFEATGVLDILQLLNSCNS
jgi:hypothetical protein